MVNSDSNYRFWKVHYSDSCTLSTLKPASDSESPVCVLYFDLIPSTGVHCARLGQTDSRDKILFTVLTVLCIRVNQMSRTSPRFEVKAKKAYYDGE